ncbi:hypothetical protein DAEQUDRAFT_756382 [Daedalea quercina L-15889]|uniref:F-box domain-containing protein n=1 Tax=Daedalea quercina L-15889 TaxID=1314783 RepID=A0A165RAI2_9APHY|nr:hypothetical protein DAEQUDRAFT_756382 [Daedalea quercina L-15889]
MLQSCPALERLEIGSIYGISDDSGQHDVTMHHLRELTLDECGSHTAVFLAHLVLPQIVNIAIQSFVTTRIQVADFFPDDKSLLPVLAAILKVQSVVTGDGLIIVAATMGDLRVEPQSITHSGEYHPEFEPMDTSWVQRGTMFQLGAIFPPSVKALHICLETREPEGQRAIHRVLADGWRALYAAFPNLEELYASGPDIDFFFDFLFDLCPYEPSSRQSALAWPGLKRIRLEYLPDTSQLQPAEPEELLHAVTTVMHNRRSAASVERLQELGIVFSEKPPVLQNLQTCFNRMHGVADRIMCIVSEEELALDEDAILSDVVNLDHTNTVD